jgi:hypothetical protein
VARRRAGRPALVDLDASAEEQAAENSAFPRNTVVEKLEEVGLTWFTVILCEPRAAPRLAVDFAEAVERDRVGAEGRHTGLHDDRVIGDAVSGANVDLWASR